MHSSLSESQRAIAYLASASVSGLGSSLLPAYQACQFSTALLFIYNLPNNLAYVNIAKAESSIKEIDTNVPATSMSLLFITYKSRTVYVKPLRPGEHLFSIASNVT